MFFFHLTFNCFRFIYIIVIFFFLLKHCDLIIILIILLFRQFSVILYVHNIYIYKKNNDFNSFHLLKLSITILYLSLPILMLMLNVCKYVMYNMYLLEYCTLFKIVMYFCIQTVSNNKYSNNKITVFAMRRSEYNLDQLIDT